MGDNSTAIMGNDLPEKKRRAFLKSLTTPIDELQAQAAEEANLYAAYFGFRVYDGSLFNIVEKVRAGFSMAAGRNWPTTWV